eukprot:gene36651-biopygen15890
MWSYGCVLFLLCTGSTLFASSIDDTLASDKVMDELHHWSEETKKRLLFRVKNSEARNLLSLLLNKDPVLRPDAGRVLNHPFITGLSSTRLQGEEPNWDVFLSYRVDSDSGHVEELYDHLPLELKGRGLIEGIYPVMIGDVADDGTYSDYF